MSLNSQGLYTTSERPRAPEGWPSGYVRHHMINWRECRLFWNALVADAANGGSLDFLTRYMSIIGFGSDRTRSDMASAIVDGDITRVRSCSPEDLAVCVCWQGYNIFLGYGRGARRHHIPDPHALLDQKVYGAIPFDFPVVAAPHGQRVNTLYRAFQEVEVVCSVPRGRPLPQGPVDAALTLLASVQHLDYLPPHEVNWFALSKKHFWGLSSRQRQTFFSACEAAGILEADGEAVYTATFGDDGI